MGGMAKPPKINGPFNAISTTEAEAKAFIAENQPLLERATPATLHRIVLHGGEIATRLSDEVVVEMNEIAQATNAITDAITDDNTSPARIQELEEERIRAAAQESTKQETFEQLSDVIRRAITLRQEREVAGEREVTLFTTKPAKPLKRGFWQRLFGGR